MATNYGKKSFLNIKHSKIVEDNGFNNEGTLKLDKYSSF